MIVLALVPIGGGVATSAGAATSVATADQTGIVPAATPVPKSYIVTLEDPGSVAVAAKAREVEDSGGTVERVYTHALAGFSATMSRARAEALAHDPTVLRVEENAVVTLAGTQSLQYPPTFPSGTDSWGLDRIDQRDLPLDLTYTSPSSAAGVHAYVIDTGILPTHTDFGGRASIGNDFVGDGKNGIDCEGHGTHVAGTLGGTRYGVAKSVDLVAVRVLNCNGSGTTAEVISGIDWVTTNAVKPAVATLSLAAGLSASLDDAVRNSISSGVTYVVAAGNKSANECSTTSPSGVAEAITAAASTITDAQASFSDFGPCIDLYAPGSSIKSDWFTSTTATQVPAGEIAPVAGTPLDFTKPTKVGDRIGNLMKVSSADMTITSSSAAPAACARGRHHHPRNQIRRPPQGPQVRPSDDRRHLPPRHPALHRQPPEGSPWQRRKNLSTPQHPLPRNPAIPRHHQPPQLPHHHPPPRRALPPPHHVHIHQRVNRRLTLQ